MRVLGEDNGNAAEQFYTQKAQHGGQTELQSLHPHTQAGQGG
jgi:hypothetical protein